MSFNLIIQLINALPEILKLLAVLQKQIDEAETQRKVSDNVKAIHEALAANDPVKLNAIFNSK